MTLAAGDARRARVNGKRSVASAEGRDLWPANAEAIGSYFHGRNEWTSAAKRASLSPCRYRADCALFGILPRGEAATVGLRR